MNFTALRYSQFRWYLLGAACSVNALWIQRVVLGWLAWAETGSAAFVGLVAAFTLAPTFFSGPFFGVLVDRGNVVRAGYYAYGTMILANAGLLACYLAGMLGPVALSVFAVVIGFISSAHHPVRMSLGPRLVSPEHVGSVVALMALNFNAARTIAPALGGLVIDRLGVGAALWFTVAVLAPPVVIVLRLRPREMEAPAPGEGFLTSMRRGFSHVRHDLLVLKLMLLTAVFSFAGRAFLEILPVIADGVYGRGAAGLGLLASSAGAGALVAALAKATLRNRDGAGIPPSAVVVAIVGFAAVGGMGLGPDWNTALALVAVAGFAGTFAGVALQSVLQNGLPDNMRGRVMSIWVVVGLGAGSLGALGLGSAAQALGIGPTLIGTAAIGMIGFAAILLPGGALKSGSQAKM